jgi:cytochrome c-type biogenesis protein CcmE
VSEKPVRVGDLVKAKEITRDQVLAAVATILDGQTALPVSDAYALILPDLSKMTPFTREAIMSAMIEARAVKR